MLVKYTLITSLFPVWLLGVPDVLLLPLLLLGVFAQDTFASPTGSHCSVLEKKIRSSLTLTAVASCSVFIVFYSCKMNDLQ